MCCACAVSRQKSKNRVSNKYFHWHGKQHEADPNLGFQWLQPSWTGGTVTAPSAVTHSSCRVRNHNHVHSQTAGGWLWPRVTCCAVQPQVPAHSECTHSTVTSYHWQFNCSSFSSCPFQHSCLFFCNLNTTLSEVSDSGILTGIVVCQCREERPSLQLFWLLSLALPTFSCVRGSDLNNNMNQNNGRFLFSIATVIITFLQRSTIPWWRSIFRYTIAVVNQ